MSEILEIALKFGLLFFGEFTPVLAKLLKSFSLIDCISVVVDGMHRNFSQVRKLL